MKALIDTNVLIDVALQRAEHLAESDAVVKWCEAHPGQGFVAWHSIANTYYLVKGKLGDASAREFIATVLDIFEVPATDTASAKLALRLAMSDLEDALQAAAAVELGADVIVTRDRTGYAESPIPAKSPGDFLASVTP